MMQKMYITKVKHIRVVHLMKVTLICLGKNQQIIKKMGKGSKIKGLGSSWMSKHVRNLLTEMPIDNRASGKGMAEYGKMGPGKHGMHKGPGKHHPGMAEYGKPKGPGKHGYGPHMEHGKGPAQTFLDKAQDALSDLTSYRLPNFNANGSLLDSSRNSNPKKRLIPQSDYTINKQKAQDSIIKAKHQKLMDENPYYAKSVERQRAKQNQKKS